MTKKELKYTENDIDYYVNQRNQWYEDKLMKLIECLKPDNLTKIEIQEHIEYVLKVTHIIPKD